MKKPKKIGKNMAIRMDLEVLFWINSFSLNFFYYFSYSFRYCIAEMVSWSSKFCICSFGLCWHIYDCSSRHCCMFKNKTYFFLLMISFFFLKCVWWQKSARYSGDQILIDTIQLYWIFLSKTSSIIIKRKLIEWV
jgi:hypothetical protein